MLTRSNIASLLTPELYRLYDDSFKELPMLAEKIFNTFSSDKQDELVDGMTGFGLLEETGEGENVVYEDPNTMYRKRFIHKKYTKGFKVTEEALEDDMYNSIKNKAKALGRAARRTVEKVNADVLNHGWSTSYLGGDGVPLFSTVHPRSDGGSSQSNASATGLTLTDDNLNTALVASRQQLDDKGQRVQIMPNRVIVPVDLERDASIIANSNSRSGTADNDLNFYKGKFDIIAWEYLTLNDTMWMLQDSSQHQLSLYWRIKPEFKQDEAFDAALALYKVRTRFSTGWSDWRGVWGSLGDGAAYAS